MRKKLATACAAIAALAAFVVVPVVSASPVLTSEGKAVAVGTEIAGKSTGEVKLTGSSPVICSSASFTMKLTSNTGTQFKGEIAGGELLASGTGTGGDCTSALGAVNWLWNRLCVETVIGTDNFRLNGCGLSSAATFTTGLTGSGTCKYSSASITSSFLTNADAALNITGQPVALEEGGIFCPSSQTLDMNFDLTTTSGGTLLVS
jgi:hypothetical protein